ncbi:MAG: thioredoxin domain-containing protein [Candidatus Omnitrophica bacterium CG11_big_fil_rev_8_21_14_0_20_45_26]|uniref:Thioredoxin domain-containing protein n=1 Tax=Candidatus Abzuiibacterium crystallinum TaxID=1974748 RepID=A0A2H0LNV8_9BACT|nr:MAG: thioredoxin domain-containing protein [Candidatus Omnitrophica bacterium CG11_big_fil_rev_8_21_14_0_20_45_26]PIW65663.1 MAG: thioredoxin domain-containing protein [Candidatus Omnitrophica bacterium CG12_big_fil_rev_8_21_14_0_65_45_16]
MPSMPQNRLAQEKSPYLLQHANNPVDWYAWGEEAFQKARSENKPIFLSIGYSTCHWCHVMEKESFTNPSIADLLNQNFVSIKVDREERPDIDHIYMQAVMAMSGSGGWPMSVFLTPDLKPFYGGTYFPPEDRWGRPGFTTLLNAIHQKWQTEREAIDKAGDELTRAIQQGIERRMDKTNQPIDAKITLAFAEQMLNQFDFEFGGFGEAPKFPRSHTIAMLLRVWHKHPDPQWWRLIELTLDRMAEGGIHDQLGGGFHRYSTDREWHVPHFEKMLYDQALIAKVYLEAYQASGQKKYADVARSILDDVLANLTDAGGGFYSAEDADSPIDFEHPHEKKEGAFYVWSENEILKHLGEEKGRLFSYVYGIKPNGNASADPHGAFLNRNILTLKHQPADAAKQFNLPIEIVRRQLEDSRIKLLEVRRQRPRPHLDDKILTDWNGLMISTFASAHQALGEEKYQRSARKAADFILEKMKNKQGRLMHRYRDGDVQITGFLDDYAFFTLGLIDLYESTFDARYLKEVKFLAHELVRLFWDQLSGGFFLTANDSEKLIARTKEVYDGAIPSGNSVAAFVLLKAGRLLNDASLEARGRETIEAFTAELKHFPGGYPYILMALDFLLGPTKEIVIAGKADSPETKQMIQTVRSLFMPNCAVLFHPENGESKEQIEKLSPFIAKQTMQDHKTTAYVCENYVCKEPIHDAARLTLLLQSSNQPGDV